MLYGVTSFPIEMLDLPPIVTSTAFTVRDGATLVGTVAASDPDLGDVIVFSIAGGDDAALFSINSATGELSFLSAPSYSSPADLDGDNIYDLTIEVSDSVLSTTQAIAVTVAKVVALSGVSLSVSAGNLTALRPIGLVGVSAALSAGALAETESLALPGIGMTMSAGIFNLVSVAVPGVALTASAGAIAAAADKTMPGAGTTIAAGSLSFPQPFFDAASAHAATLSNGALTVTNTGTTSTDQGAKALNPKASGKYYFEVTVTTRNGGGNVGFGIGTDASTYANMGNDATTGAMIFINTSNVYVNGSFHETLNGLGILQGEIGCIAYDRDNGSVWFRYQNHAWNGSALADPATNTGGHTLPAGALEPFATFGGSSGVSGNALTFNFGGTAFAYTAPSGFVGPNP